MGGCYEASAQKSFIIFRLRFLKNGKKIVQLLVSFFFFLFFRHILPI